MSYITPTRTRISSTEPRGHTAPGRPGSRSWTRWWVAVPLAAASLLIPAAAAGETQSTQAPQFPTARQIAMHEGRLAPSTQRQFPSARQVAMHEGRLAPSTQRQFPSARQVAMHEGTLAENPTAAASSPPSDGNSDTLLIVLSGAALLAVLGATGFVVGVRARTRRSLQPGA